MEISMERNEKIKVCKIIAILFCTGVFITSCNTLNAFNYRQVSCDFDYRVEKEDMVLDTLKYVLGKEYENDSCTIRSSAAVSGYNKLDFDKYVHYKKTGIYKIISYYPDFRIKSAFFIFMNSDVGKRFDFDEKGNLTKIKDNDEGYTICWAQALAIGRHRANGQLHEPNANENLTKDEIDGRNYWIYAYDDKEMHPWLIEINAQTGRIKHVRRIHITP